MKPVPEEIDHGDLVTGGGQEIEMIRTQRPVPHHTEARQPVALLQGEAAEELRVVDDQQEVAVRATGPLQPPRSQEGRRNGGGIHQSVPLRRPPAQVGDVNQLGWRPQSDLTRSVHDRGVGAAEDNHRPLPADTWSRSLCWLLAAGCWLLATVARNDSAHLRESRSRQTKSVEACSVPPSAAGCPLGVRLHLCDVHARRGSGA